MAAEPPAAPSWAARLLAALEGVPGPDLASAAAEALEPEPSPEVVVAKPKPSLKPAAPSS